MINMSIWWSWWFFTNKNIQFFCTSQGSHWIELLCLDGLWHRHLRWDRCILPFVRSDPPGWFSGDLGPCGVRRGLPGSAGSVAGYPWEALEKSWLVQRPWDMDGYHWSTLLVLWRGLSSKSQMNIFFNHQYDIFFHMELWMIFGYPYFLSWGNTDVVNRGCGTCGKSNLLGRRLQPCDPWVEECLGNW